MCTWSSVHPARRANACSSRPGGGYLRFVVKMELPDIPGVSDRGFEGPADYAAVAEMVTADAQEDAPGLVVSPEEVRRSFENNPLLDLGTGFRMVEVDGVPVGYVIVRWMQEEDGPRIYRHMCKLDPAWRGRGIGTAMLHWAQDRLREIAADHKAGRNVFRTDTDERQKEQMALLEAEGYTAIEYNALLVRPDLDDIPDAPLPEGLEIRPVTEDQLRTIFDADTEAFRDHWGFVEPNEGDWAQFLEFEHRDESMWKVAWNGDRVAGQVRSFINESENERYGRKRGWCEFISTAREWRGKGVATALICESLRELRSRGMTEAALGVHVDNPHGAYRLYTGLGFEFDGQGVVYEKSL